MKEQAAAEGAAGVDKVSAKERASDEEVETGAEPTAGDGESEGGDGAPSVYARAEHLQLELEETHERLLRALADFENYKRRSERERVDLRRHGASEPLREFLSVVDSLELAMTSKGSFEDLKAGVQIILNQMKQLLSHFDIEEVAAEGEPFDPALHEAIARYEDDEVSEQVVAEELQKGYLMNGRLLRPAMVKVAVPPEPPRSDQAEEQD